MRRPSGETLLLGGAFVALAAARGGKVLPAAVLLCALVLLMGARRLWDEGAEGWALPGALLLFWQAASAVWGGCPEGGFLTMGRFWAAAAVLVIVRAAPEGALWSRRFLFAGAAAHMGVLLLRRLGVPAPDVFPGNPVYGAFWLVLAFVTAFAERDFRWAGFFAAGILMSATRTPLEGAWGASRTAPIMGLAGLMIALALHGRKRALLWVALALFAAVVLCPSALLERALKFDDPSAWKRLDIWRTAWEGIAARPWLGWGPGQFETLYHLHAVPQAGPLRFDHVTYFAHDDYLQLASASGLPAILFFLWGAVRWIRGVPAGERASLAAPATAAAVAAVNFPLALPVNAWLLGGLLARVPSASPPVGRWGRPARRVLAAGWALLALVQIFFLPQSVGAPPESIFYGRAAVFLARAQEAIGNPARRWEGAAWADLSLRWHPRRAEALRARASLTGAEGTPAAAARAAADLWRALSLRPAQAAWWLELGLWSELAGRPDDARGAFHQALRVEPGFAEAAFHVARLMAARGDVLGARRWLERLRAAPAALPPPGAAFSPYGRRILARDPASIDALLEASRSTGKDKIKR